MLLGMGETPDPLLTHEDPVGSEDGSDDAATPATDHRRSDRTPIGTRNSHHKVMVGQCDRPAEPLIGST